MSQNLGRINEALLKQIQERGETSSVAPDLASLNMNEQVSALARAYQKAIADQSSGTNLSVAEFNKAYVLTAYTAIHQRIADKLQKIYNSVDGIRDFYLVEVILSQLTEDALAPKIGSDEIVKFSHKDPKVEESINDMKERIGLDQLIQNITPDLCAYGDYVLETDISIDKGLMGLYDNVEQGRTIPLMQDGRCEGYLHVDMGTELIEKRELPDFVHFSLGGQRIRVQFDTVLPAIVKNNERLRQFFKKTPKYLRVGRSMIYPVLGKLRELELLEKLVPATKINKLSQGNTIGVPVPENFDLERGFNAAKQIEGNINRKVMIDNTMKEITVEAILSTAGRTRVIPIFGDKGRLENLQYKEAEADDLFQNCKGIRDLILDSVGVPSELVFKSDGADKNDTLKRHAKYLRKLKKIQKAIIEGCRQIIAIHLANSEEFQDIDPNSVDVVLNNNLVEIDSLDRLEFADITIAHLKNLKEFFDSLLQEGSPYRSYVKMSAVIEFIEESLKTIGLADAIETNQELLARGEISQSDAEERDRAEDQAINPDLKPADDLAAPGANKAYPDIPFDPTKSPDDKGKKTERYRVSEKKKGKR